MGFIANLSGVEQVGVAVTAGVVLAALGTMVRAGVQTYEQRVSDRRAADALDKLEQADVASLSEWFFGRQANPRTGVPGRKGWAAEVEERLDTLSTEQAAQKNVLNEVLVLVKANTELLRKQRGA